MTSYITHDHIQFETIFLTWWNCGPLTSFLGWVALIRLCMTSTAQ